jgi:transcriptional regulator with XRE-family HTH domain
MGKKFTDIALRQRLRLWLLHFEKKYAHQYPRRKDLAEAMKIAAPTLSQVSKEARGIGLEILVRMHRTFHVSADVLLDTDPPAESDRPFCDLSGVVAPRKRSA